MDSLESAHINCPYCGEPLQIIIETSVGRQDYIEDCQVCCKPIQFRIRMGEDGQSRIDVRSEDES
jgi:hypothetical protein